MSTIAVNRIETTAGAPLLEVSNSQASGVFAPVGMRNRIINGDMRIDQRNAGASVDTSNTAVVVYTLDRWAYRVLAASKFTIQRNAGAITPPAGFTNYLGCTSSSSYSVTSGDVFNVWQPIEGFNTADLAFGTASAQSVTVSFWVRSSLTGTFSGACRNDAANRSYVFTYSISAANTWEYKTVTIAGDTTGTWETGNNTGLFVQFSLGVGSTYSAPSAGSWQAGNFFGLSSAVSVVGTSGATFYITGVQLEAGSVATPFERRPYSTELQLAQRYYWQQGWTANYENILNPCRVNAGGGGMTGQMHMPVTMRVAPTLTHNGVGNFRVNNDANDQTCNGITQTYVTTRSSTISFSKATANMTASTAGYINTELDNDAYLYFSAEL